MDNLIYQIEKIATVRNVVLALLTMILFAVALMPYAEKEITAAAGHPVTIPDLQFTYTATQLNQFFETMGQQGRSVYAFTACSADIVYPLSMAFFWILLLGRLRRMSNTTPKWLVLIPLVTIAADYIENIYLLLVLGQFPDPAENLAAVAVVFTGIKWFFALMSALLALYLAMRWRFGLANKA